LVGCHTNKATDKEAEPANPYVGQTNESQPRVLETIDWALGKEISTENRARVSSIGLKVLGHVSKAQQDIQAKNVDAAKTEVTQAVKLLDILKKVLPTVKVIDHIWVTKTNLSYINTTEVQQDLVPIIASIDQLYDVLPEGKAKEHAKQAKAILTKEKTKGAPKAKEELEAVEEILDFSEVDLSVSYTSRLVNVAQEDLEKGKTKEANDALKAVSGGVVFFDETVIAPVNVALRGLWMATQDYTCSQVYFQVAFHLRGLWMATQDYTGKDYKAAKTKMGMAKKTLQNIAESSDKTLQEDIKTLIRKIDAIDVTKAGEKTEAALEALWQDARKLFEQPQIKSNDKSATEAKTADQTFIQTADQIDLTDVKLGKVAQEHAASDAVKKYGERAVRDHSLMNKELKEITTKKGIVLTEKLDQKHQDLLDQLSKLKGSEFDRAYTKDMVPGHEKAIEQFEIEVKNGMDTEVKAWAEKWLPTLREHLKLAQLAIKDVNGK
jgi:putative membrane protein